MLVVEVAPHAGVHIDDSGCEGVLSQAVFEELMDTALQYEEVLGRVLEHPRVQAQLLNS